MDNKRNFKSNFSNSTSKNNDCGCSGLDDSVSIGITDNNSACDNVSFRKFETEVPYISIGFRQSNEFVEKSNLCYSESNSKENEENKNMSLVGLFRCSDGIVGIGDYKSTCTLFELKYDELDRFPQKVFNFKKFILATFGNNDFIKDGKRYLIENVIKEIVDEFDDAKNFCQKFKEKISGIDLDFYFFIGLKKDNKYELFSVKINKEDITYKQIYSPSVFGGDKKYYEIMCSLAINPNQKTKIVAKKLEKALKSLIELYSVEDIYQTVGTNDKGEILIEIFK